MGRRLEQGRSREEAMAEATAHLEAITAQKPAPQLQLQPSGVQLGQRSGDDRAPPAKRLPALPPSAPAPRKQFQKGVCGGCNLNAGDWNGLVEHWFAQWVLCYQGGHVQCPFAVTQATKIADVTARVNMWLVRNGKQPLPMPPPKGPLSMRREVAPAYGSAPQLTHAPPPYGPRPPPMQLSSIAAIPQQPLHQPFPQIPPPAIFPAPALSPLSPCPPAL
ncbi:hypothetical protein JKP88DRAFT_233862 [Tribonema minus]|uniref:Uncharacterized protein n=1 Tax=Tribonema minus TaxID=303371 RepID=A0A836CKP6_9STRA|nr:hypothetical protein JKP88DRAFT_233862 [Tribonema minus]